MLLQQLCALFCLLVVLIHHRGASLRRDPVVALRFSQRRPDDYGNNFNRRAEIRKRQQQLQYYKTLGQSLAKQRLANSKSRLPAIKTDSDDEREATKSTFDEDLHSTLFDKDWLHDAVLNLETEDQLVRKVEYELTRQIHEALNLKDEMKLALRDGSWQESDGLSEDSMPRGFVQRFRRWVDDVKFLTLSEEELKWHFAMARLPLLETEDEIKKDDIKKVDDAQKDNTSMITEGADKEAAASTDDESKTQKARSKTAETDCVGFIAPMWDPESPDSMSLTWVHEGMGSEDIYKMANQELSKKRAADKIEAVVFIDHRHLLNFADVEFFSGVLGWSRQPEDLEEHLERLFFDEHSVEQLFRDI